MRIFISYGHDEQAILAKRLAKDLKARGHDVRSDHDLPPGVDWEERLEQELELVARAGQNGCLLLLMTPHAVRRPNGYCLNEIAWAVWRRLTVIPVMVVWCEPPLSICRIQWLDMQDCIPLQECQDRYEKKFAMLADTLARGRFDFEGTQAHLLSVLDPLPFDAEIAQYMRDFCGRKWVLDHVDQWLVDPRASQVLWIRGLPGVGKTALAVWLAHSRDEIAALHLCRHGHMQKADPRRCVLSVAYQLATQLPEYQARLAALDLRSLVAGSNAATLFDFLIVQPLSARFPTPDRPVAILIDALDEATVYGRNELAEFIGSEFERMPAWLRLIVTSRPVPEVANALQAVDPFEFDTAMPENEQDLRDYFLARAAAAPGEGEVPSGAIETVISRSQGLFLYVHCVCEELRRGRLSLDRLHAFPQGLGGVYSKFLREQFPDADFYSTEFRPVMEVIAAVREPASESFLSGIFNWNEYQLQDFRRAAGALLTFRDGNVMPFHHSIVEWLTDSSKAGLYFVSEQEGHRRLAEYAWRQYEAGVNTMDRYGLSHLPIHLYETEQWDALERFLADTNVIEARFAADMVYDIVRGLALFTRARRSDDKVTESILTVLKGKLFERRRQQLRSALNQVFGLYDQWPATLREKLEQSTDLTLVLFVADTHDMEERFEQAEIFYQQMLETADPDDLVTRASASARLAFVLEHKDRPQEGLEATDQFNAIPDVEHRCAPLYYWWVQYQRMVCLNRLHRYDEAIGLGKTICEVDTYRGHRTSALHQLGVIDLELGRFAEAEEKFLQCMQNRGDKEWDHRRAFEHRRLGQLFALTGQPDKARNAFEKAIVISNSCGNRRLARHAERDLAAFIDIPAYLRSESLERVVLDDLARQLDVKRSQLAQAFRVLWQEQRGYLPVIDPNTGEPTGEAVPWNIAHTGGEWHAVAHVVMFDHAGNIALQERQESDSRGKWDVSVGGHQEIGETDVWCAIRETAEETGLVIGTTRLIWLGPPSGFVKEGRPDGICEGHQSPFLYRYRTEGKINLERAAVFLLQIAEDEKRRMAQMQRCPLIWQPIGDVVADVASRPGGYASAIKQLLHPEVLTEVEETIRRFQR